MANASIQFNEKAILFDVLNSEKFLSGIYNNDILETATPELKRCFCSMLSDTHDLQHDIFNELSNRGYYPVEQAEQQKIDQAKQKYGQCVTA